ncbi:MAG TPA: prepilin-type N-terminal cleavage/methylation domain-containing protein [Candidatus Sulfotelmatobacter sp.]|nr:prepilin-type N-terminal cleavage/methylation domain-containing protein [Candidatus Sulfotelmatobacter sp.]
MKMGIVFIIGNKARAGDRPGSICRRQCLFRRSIAKAGVSRRSVAKADAFTLIELLVVIAIIAILAAVLLPVLHQAQLRGQTATCIDNQKQLATAWLLYASDNNDACAGNNWNDEELWLQNIHWHQNWVSGWEGANGSGGNGISGNAGGPDNTNPVPIINPTYATLADYTKNVKLYLCPSSIVLAPTKTGSPPQPPLYPLIRSVSMNCWVGYNCAPPNSNDSQYVLGTSPTVDYSADLYQTFSKVTQMRGSADPADIIVFTEERAESIDDGSFEISEPTTPGQAQGSPSFPNIPTDYHNGAATLAFGDGHVGGPCMARSGASTATTGNRQR